MAALSHSPAQIVANLLIGLNAAEAITSTNWPVFSTNEPDTPDNCITVYDTTGIDEGQVAFNGELQQHYGIQFRIRAREHLVGFAKASSIRQVVTESVLNRTVTLDDVHYNIHAITRVSTVIALGNETPNSKRKLFTVNAVVSISIYS